MKDFIRKFVIRGFSINIVVGNYTQNDMYNAFESGRQHQRGADDSHLQNRFSGAFVSNKEPMFPEWITEYNNQK